MEKIYKSMTGISITTFAERIVEQAKDSKLILEKKDFAEFFKLLSAKYISLEKIRQRITKVSEGTRLQILAQIQIGYKQGLGVSAIASNISAILPSISQTRGALIARTETHGAANYGADGAARSTGVDVRKEWVSAEDERTREAHRVADGQIVEMDAPFTVGGEQLMFAGDPNGSGGNIINCRCAISHILKE